MKKILFVVLSILIMASVFIGVVGAQGSSESSSAEKITIRYADVQAEGDTETMAARKFAELVKEKSNGRIEVQVFPGGQLGDMKHNLQSVQMGSVEMTRTNPGWLADAGVKKMLVISLPFIFDNLEHANKVIEGEIGQELLGDIQKNLSMIGLGYLQPSLRNFFFRSKEVKSLSDIRGLKLRVPTNEMAVAMVNALGASATPIAYNELYSALQTGLVDGAENPLKGFINIKFCEVAKYFTFTGHQYEPSIYLVSESLWNRLSQEDQNIMKEAMHETNEYYKEISKDLFNKYIAEGERVGVKFTEVNDIKEWQDAVQPVYERLGKGLEDLIKRIKNTK